MYLVTTLGFDEKFQIRSLMRHSGEVEEVIIVKPKEADENKDTAKKARAALNSFQEILNKLGVKYEVIDIEINNLEAALIKLVQRFKELKGKKVVVNVSGGMRALILEVIFSFLILGMDVDFEMETEDFSALLTFSSNDVNFTELDEDEKALLIAVNKGVNTVNRLHKNLNIPLSTAWRRVRKLESKGCLKRTATENANSKLELTLKGRILAEVLSSGNEKGDFSNQ
ncbi:MAG: CRISPR-associated CARF protein Csa3 [Sulfolobaceae archaeon]|nr:CRISPR-associated CARF protein Csa3 [Sulfolobaceae archaeon]